MIKTVADKNKTLQEVRVQAEAEAEALQSELSAALKATQERTKAQQELRDCQDSMQDLQSEVQRLNKSIADKNRSKAHFVFNALRPNITMNVHHLSDCFCDHAHGMRWIMGRHPRAAWLAAGGARTAGRKCGAQGRGATSYQGFSRQGLFLFVRRACAVDAALALPLVEGVGSHSLTTLLCPDLPRLPAYLLGGNSVFLGRYGCSKRPPRQKRE